MKTLLVLLLALLMLPAVAHARTATITWEPPTTRTDGSALAPTEIDGYVFSCRTGEGEHDDLLIIPNGETPSATALYTDLFTSYGEYLCAMRTVDTQGLESPLSNEVVVTHFAGPESPKNLEIITENPGIISRIGGMVGRLFR